jgi:NADH-quinone oxidoreductase subunit G
MPLPLARSRELAQASAVLLIGDNLTDRHPLLAWNIREGVRLHGTRLYVVHSRKVPLLRQAHQFLPVLEGREKDALAWLNGRSDVEPELLVRTPGGREVTPELLADFRERLLRERDVAVAFGSEITGDAVWQLVQLGGRLHGQTRYLVLGDYSNSRGAADMGLLPHLLPGYRPVDDAASRSLFESRWSARVPENTGWPLAAMLQAFREQRLASLYVVGANPWKGTLPDELRGKGFLLVQDLFLHETAQAADVVLPAASTYEKTGTVTNTCGEMQRLRKAVELVGTRTDLQILVQLADALGARLAPSRPDEILTEISQLVAGYAIPMASVLAGGAGAVHPASDEIAVRAGIDGSVDSARDTLFTSGTLGRYSNTLQTVPERLTRKQPEPC